MVTTLLFARLALLLVFVVSGVAKLLDLAGSRAALRGFGVPGALAVPGGLLLPLVELTVAALLLPAATTWAAAVAALLLLLGFSGGVALSLARGRRPACHCFGQLSEGPIGGRTLVRNAALVALAGVVVVAGACGARMETVPWQGGSVMAGWIGLGLGGAALLIGVAVVWLLAQLIGQNGRLLSRLDALESRLATGTLAPGVADAADAAVPGLPVGSVAPAFQLPGLFGEVLTLDALRATGRPALLAFVDPGCGPCNALLPDLARWQKDLAGTVTLALVSRGTPDENRAKTQEHGLTQVLLQTDREVAAAYQAHGTPSMVLIRPDGTIGSALAQGAEQIRALVARSLGQPALQPAVAPPAPVIPLVPAPAQAAQPGQPCPQCGKVHDPAPAAPAGAAIGAPAPSLTLPDLDGRLVELSGPRGQDTVALLWNPGCGFCQRLLPELKAWEQNRPDGAPALLVVSTGEKAANESQGFLSPLLLQQGFEAGAALGLNGTPSAVLIDKAGNVASAPAVGGPAVMALLGAPTPA